MFVDIYGDFLQDFMSLIQHVIRASTLLKTMRVAGHHATTHSLDEGRHNDDEGDYNDHNDEGDDHDHDDEDADDDASGGATPSYHGHYGVSDLFGSTPSHQSPDDDQMPELEEVMYVFPNIVCQPPSHADQPIASTTHQPPPIPSPHLSSTYILD